MYFSLSLRRERSLPNCSFIGCGFSSSAVCDTRAAWRCMTLPLKLAIQYIQGREGTIRKREQ
jgi:hypothetical protein